jgi:hypothetical protein
LHELIDPHLLEIDRIFEQEFEGMTLDPIPLPMLLETRERLIADIHSRLTGPAADFLLSVHDGTPDFGLIGLDAAAELPAIRWKLTNIERLKEQNPAKHAAQRKALKEALAKAA